MLSTSSALRIPAGLGAISGPEGHFKVEHRKVGSYTVRALMKGYVTEIRDNVIVRSGEATNLLFELRVDPTPQPPTSAP
jgi:hypothetical protein